MSTSKFIERMKELFGIFPETEEHKKKLSEIRKGMIRCYDLQEHKNVTISKNIYYSISDRYCHHNSKRCKEDKGVS